MTDSQNAKEFFKDYARRHSDMSADEVNFELSSEQSLALGELFVRRLAVWVLAVEAFEQSRRRVNEPLRAARSGPSDETPKPAPEGNGITTPFAAAHELFMAASYETLKGEQSSMSGYPENPEFREFMEVFRERYVFEGEDGQQLIAMTSKEALLLSKYLFRGILDWLATPANETEEGPDLGASLERFAARYAEEPNLSVNITEGDLKALGRFLLQGLVGVVLTMDRRRMEPAHTRGQSTGDKPGSGATRCLSSIL